MCYFIYNGVPGTHTTPLADICKTSRPTQGLQGHVPPKLLCDDSEKLAAAGDRAWLGSANASCAFGIYDMIDWGLTTNDAAIARTARARLEATWRTARPMSS